MGPFVADRKIERSSKKQTQPERVWCWMTDHTGWIFCSACLLALGATTYISIERSEAEWQCFRNECIKDRKEYECVALWRAGNSKTDVIPIPMIVPIGR